MFDPDVIHEIGIKGIGQPHAQMFDCIIGALSERYPGQIDGTQPWIFSNAGGVMVQIKVLYASASEYILLFGTPVGTGGHSGRHFVEFYDTVLDGEAWYYHEGQLTRDVYKTGDRIFVGKGESAGMYIPDHVWMIEYARGALPLSLPFGLADSLLSTLDFKTVARTLAVYVSLASRRLSKSQRALLTGLAVSVLIVYVALRIFAEGKMKASS